MDKVDSKYTLVHLSARRAREINAYYHSLGEGLGQYTPPLVDQVDSNKPLSIAMEEIAATKIVPQYPGDAQRVAAELLGPEAEAAVDQMVAEAEASEAEAFESDADVVALDSAEDTQEAEGVEDTEG